MYSASIPQMQRRIVLPKVMNYIYPRSILFALIYTALSTRSLTKYINAYKDLLRLGADVINTAYKHGHDVTFASPFCRWSLFWMCSMSTLYSTSTLSCDSRGVNYSNTRSPISRVFSFINRSKFIWLLNSLSTTLQRTNDLLSRVWTNNFFLKWHVFCCTSHVHISLRAHCMAYWRADKFSSTYNVESLSTSMCMVLYSHSNLSGFKIRRILLRICCFIFTTSADA